MNHWLETSVLVTLHFRNTRVSKACGDVLPKDGVLVVPQYVIFELARGYVSYLRGANTGFR